MSGRAPGTPLGLLVRSVPLGHLPPAPVERPAGARQDEAVWYSSSARSASTRRLAASVKLVSLATTLAVALAAGVFGLGAGFWWWLDHLMSAHH